MTIEVGALEQAYAKIETSYALDAASGGETLSATDAIRHLELSITSKKNRDASPQKRGTPDEAQSMARRQTQAFNLSSIMWEPSGTLGTISNIGKFFQAGMGTKHAISGGLSTTVSASPSPTTTGFTVASATNLAVGDLFAVVTSNGTEVSRVKTLATAAITCDALSAAPASGAAFLAGITYQLASSLASTLALYKFYNAGGHAQAVFGAVVDQFTVTFDGTKEVMAAFSGPAGRYADLSTGGGTIQSKPGSHTTVGAGASGMVGNFYVDGNAFLVIAAKIQVNNNLELRNKELGTAWATGVAGRTNNRKIKVSVTFYLEDTNLIGKANSVTRGVLRLIVGSTSGSIVAAVMPSVEFEIPDIGGEIGPKEVTVEGMCYATAGNDGLYLAEM